MSQSDTVEVKPRAAAWSNRINGQTATTLLPWAVFVLLYVALVLTARNYLGTAQLSILLASITILGVVAMGQLCVILIGGIDLSVATVVTFTNVVSASISRQENRNLLMAVVVSLAIGAAVGIVNGLIITKLGMPDMIATLATMTIVMGILYLYNNTHLKGGTPPALQAFMKFRFFGFMVPAAAVWIVLAVILIIVLNKTTFGRQVYAVGLSRGASHAAGISVVRITIILYVISGVCAAAAGVLLTGNTGASQLNSGTNYQLWSIAAVVLGGTSIFGGRGGYCNTIAGVGIIMVLYALLPILGIAPAGQQVLYGLVILVMLVIFRFGGKRDDSA